MDSLDLQVLQQARDRYAAGRGVWLANWLETDIETRGCAPRAPAAIAVAIAVAIAAAVVAVKGGVDRVQNKPGSEKASQPVLSGAR